MQCCVRVCSACVYVCVRAFECVCDVRARARVCYCTASAEHVCVLFINIDVDRNQW